MRIFLFSDFHDSVNLSKLEAVLADQPEPDAVFTLGDISVSDLLFACEIAGSAPIYGVSGNHDGPSTLLLPKIPNIHTKKIDIYGVSFAGFEGSVRYKQGDYPMFTQKESIQIGKTIPSADILISHDKAYCGKTFSFSREISGNPHEGLRGISWYLKKHHPFLHIHGHIHENKRYFSHGVDTICVCGAAVIEIENRQVQAYEAHQLY